jgi:hypothetical protein
VGERTPWLRSVPSAFAAPCAVCCAGERRPAPASATGQIGWSGGAGAGILAVWEGGPR